VLAPYTPLSVSGEIPTTEAMLMIVPAARWTKAARDGIGEARERGDVESDHLVHLFDLSVQQARDGGDAGIVDEHGDGLVFPEGLLHLREIRLVVEVGRQQSDRASGLPRQADGERLEPCLVTGHQDEVIAALCETIGIDGADALEAPVTRAVPFDEDFLMLFSFGGANFRSLRT
jgi:hypothetical protein